MSLPNPGMDFDPLDVLPAASLDDLVENIEALAAGSGLDNSAVTSDKIATNSHILAYVETSAGQSFATAGPTDATSMTVTFTTPASCTKILLRAEATVSSDSATATTTVYITNGANTDQVHRDIITGQANINAKQAISISRRITVTASTSYTFKMRVGNSGFTSALNQGDNAASPTMLWVERA